MAAIKNTEPSEEQIQKQIDAQIASKMAVASISAVGDTVYVACSDTVGYGYGVWKVDDKFQAGEQIVSGLRGCCGQMDVQACESGIYVAENARHRVACFDTSGKETTSWGGSAADGAEGFSSCCNPMNVAFGQDGSVFTAESTSGRIKQYSPEGKLQQVIGTVDLVPGCKKVSIGVGQEGQRVYMLDITRHHIVVMEPIPTSDREAMIKEAMEPEAPEADEDETAEATASIAPAGRATGVQARRIGQLRRVAPAASTEAASEPQE